MVHCKGKIQFQVKSYQESDNLKIAGYASTFEVDRSGEYFVRGAWSKAIQNYLATNPVLLLNHDPEIQSIVGKVVKLEETDKGLYFEALITQDPAFESVRFRVKEGFINSVSVSGRWNYDGLAIPEVTDLYEISLVAVPCNAGALVGAKSFEKNDIVEKEKPTLFQFVK